MRKLTTGNSVRYIPITQTTKGRDIKPKTIKVGSLPRKQNKNISQNVKNSLKIFQHKDSNILTE